MNVQTTTLTPDAVFSLEPAELEKYGLRQEDESEIKAVAEKISKDSPDTIYNFGQDVAEHTSRYADAMLEQVRNKDLDEAGEKLTQVVSLARSVNISSLTINRSRLPIIGPVIDKLRVRGQNLNAKFATTKDQIDTLVKEVAVTQSGIASNSAALEQMYKEVIKEHHLLGVHIAAGKLGVVQLRDRLNEMRENAGDNPLLLQEVTDMEALIFNLEKRVTDLIVSQHSALQILPMIRVMQSNNQAIIDKFHSIQKTTVPSFKRGFLLALSLNGQRNATELANDIDDANNELLRSNAKMLHQNAVAVQKANQRLVIDISTLKEVQSELFATIDDVMRIRSEGATVLMNAEKEIKDMRDNLRTRLVNRHAEPALHKEG